MFKNYIGGFDFLREAPLQTCCYEVLWRRPKDLAGSTWGLDQCRKASPAMAETRDPSVARKRSTGLQSQACAPSGNHTLVIR
ncbi:MAG TPA: hypothetical protein VHG93_21405, partial [Longimicrobium sp.]|nr:hypothetical protein [Longimicrobium sp.]